VQDRNCRQMARTTIQQLTLQLCPLQPIHTPEGVKSVYWKEESQLRGRTTVKNARFVCAKISISSEMILQLHVWRPRHVGINFINTTTTTRGMRIIGMVQLKDKVLCTSCGRNSIVVINKR
jgi:hypothetical protein